MDLSALSTHLTGKTVVEARLDEELVLRFADGAILRVSSPFRFLSDHHHSAEQTLASRAVTGVRIANSALRISFGPRVEVMIDILDTVGPDAIVLHTADGKRLVWN